MKLPMHNALALGALLLALHPPLMAASPEELSDIRTQLFDLMQRVERLERENELLKEKNDELQTEAVSSGRNEMAAYSSQDADAGWAARVKLAGDVRYRHEQTRDDTLNVSGVRTADQYRHRVRARVNVKAQATEDVAVGIGLATAEDGDPRSSNQTLGDVFSRKSINLDLAYIDWSIAEWAHLIGGKMQQPFFKPGQSFHWDDDINPEGLALTFERGALFGSAYGYWLDEVSAPQSARTSDTMLFGGQVGLTIPLGESHFVLAVQYYDLSAGKGRAPFFGGDASGNTTTTVETSPVGVLLYDYRVMDLGMQFNTTWDAPWASVPVQIWADVAQNQDPNDLENAWAVGAMLGDAGDARTWELGAAYHSVEKDALFAQLIDSDLGGGVSDSAGWVLRAGYAPLKNVTLRATYFINEHNVDVANAVGQTNVNFERLLLDFNVDF